MRYISSTSSNDGTSTITTTFQTGYSLDIAAVDVQNRVASAQGACRKPLPAPASPSPRRLQLRVRGCFLAKTIATPISLSATTSMFM